MPLYYKTEGSVIASFAKEKGCQGAVRTSLCKHTVAVYWDDWGPGSASTGDGLFFDHQQDSEGVEYAMVTWRNVPRFDLGDSNTFQAKVFENGIIILTWGSMDADSGLVGPSGGSMDISAIFDML